MARSLPQHPVRVATVTVEADGFVTVDQEISVTSNGDSGRGGDKPPWLFRLHSRRGAEPPSRQRASVRSWRIETAGGVLLAGQVEVDRREFRRCSPDTTASTGLGLPLVLRQRGLRRAYYGRKQVDCEGAYAYRDTDEQGASDP